VIAWFVAPVAAVVDEALGDAGAVAVVGSPRLAKALAERGRKVVAEDAGAQAIVGVEASADQIAAWTDRVGAGGRIAIVERGDPTEMSRLALCAGLVAIEQRRAGRVVVTSGRVATLPG
jgi:hypothetical protein